MQSLTLDPLGAVIAPRLLAALKDAARECNTSLARDDAVKLANAREAASELDLWLKNIDKDFSAIDDLSNYDNNLEQVEYAGNKYEGDSLDELPFRSPAHFGKTARDLEEHIRLGGENTSHNGVPILLEVSSRIVGMESQDSLRRVGSDSSQVAVDVIIVFEGEEKILGSQRFL